MPAEMTRLFYAVDIHGSDRCFRKWLNAGEVYHVDALVFGGDIAGKVLVPIVKIGPNEFVCKIYDRMVQVSGGEQLTALQAQIRASGQYDVIFTPEEKREHDDNPDLVANTAFPTAVRESLKGWISLADERLGKQGIPAWVMLGNDDYAELEPVLDGEHIKNVEGSVVDLPGGFEMISLGYSNRTPWDSPRELDEDQLTDRIDQLVGRLKDPSKAIFNFHCPPYGTALDQAPLLDSDMRPRVAGGRVELGPVGSTAVRAAIERYQPLLGLHGHIHESPGTQRIGRTLVINPGSEYSDGVLKGVIVSLGGKKGIRSWQFVHG
jgi:Icc-related predicted phosphoesterase